MSENKRYIDGIEDRIIDTKTKEEFTCNSYWKTKEDIINRLNELNDENVKLKADKKGLLTELKIWKTDVDTSIKQVNELYKEKEELKKTIDSIRTAINILKELV